MVRMKGRDEQSLHPDACLQDPEIWQSIGMRKSRAKVPMGYDAIFREALGADGWIEVSPVAHLTRQQFVDALKNAAKVRGLVCDVMWAKKGWVMIQVTRTPKE